MNVASLELCKELYELSGWEDTPLVYGSFWRDGSIAHDDVYSRDHLEDETIIRNQVPVYDLGYLLRKLPQVHDLETPGLYWNKINQEWCADYGNEMRYAVYADDPEDAVAKLAIELFKQGILTRVGE